MADRTLKIWKPEHVNTLSKAAEILLDCELDNAREVFTKSGAFVDMNEASPHMQRACALQEIIQTLSHIPIFPVKGNPSIPLVSHKHPTIIPLSGIQAECIDSMLELAYDIASDTVLDPIHGMRECNTERLTELNASIDELESAIELKTLWFVGSH